MGLKYKEKREGGKKEIFFIFFFLGANLNSHIFLTKSS